MNSPYRLPTECLTCQLRSDNFFCGLSQESLAAFTQIKHGVVFPEGTIIFVEGQNSAWSLHALPRAGQAIHHFT
jgi:hypothetical protein